MYKRQSSKIDKSNKRIETYNSYVHGSDLTINIDSNTDLNLSLLLSLFESINNYKISVIGESVIDGSDSSVTVPSVICLPFFSKLAKTIGDRHFHDIKINVGTITVFEIVLLQFRKNYGHLIRQKQNKAIMQKLKDYTFPVSDLNLYSVTLQIDDKHIYRSYSKNSWKQRGQFYGTIPLLPINIKPCLLINGEKVCVLDFQSMQINMCYHMEGVNFQHDPYNIGPLGRGIFKKASRIMLHAASEKMAKKALEDELQDGNLDINGIIQCFKKIHARISKYFCSGAGPGLENLEADITELILKRLLKKNILALPVHNSFIVQKHHREALYFTMLESYKSVMNFYPVVK